MAKKYEEIPCQRDNELRKKIVEFAEVLKTESHILGSHGLDENEFYQSGLFRGTIERIRGQFSAAMAEKRGFVALVLGYLQDQGFISEWQSAGENNRHDYTVTMLDGRLTAIELKGCLDGNNTNIFERPPHADEFVIWSVCSNAGADPRHNVWSGIHTRLSAEIISREQRVDGLVVWDWLCGTIGRPCPKLAGASERAVTVGQYEVTPPCIYMMPSTIPSPRNNPSPVPQPLDGVKFLRALHDCFGGRDEELHEVQFTVGHDGNETVRTTEIRRGGNVVRRSDPTPIRRS